MINLDYVTRKEAKEHNSLRLWINKKNPVFNLTGQQPDVDRIYLYAEDPYEAKCKFLINKRESTGLKHCNYFY